MQNENLNFKARAMILHAAKQYRGVDVSGKETIDLQKSQYEDENRLVKICNTSGQVVFARHYSRNEVATIMKQAVIQARYETPTIPGLLQYRQDLSRRLGSW